ncbi:DUF488 domain-containing protein [Methanosphaerula subterraneus]|uniref:DUF488 domain-containing protein n=1 Tax=Methanosphaerula subterraneus TaxID=3350244 RepID=UPI003F87ABD8
MTILLKRVYEPAAADDGYRVLVERLWPRGLSRERARLDRWVKDAGASDELRKWFGHDPERWEEFRSRYFVEIQGRPAIIRELEEIIHENPVVTFLFAAHDEEHNNAVALREFMNAELKGHDPSGLH